MNNILEHEWGFSKMIKKKTHLFSLTIRLDSWQSILQLKTKGLNNCSSLGKQGSNGTKYTV